MENLTLPFNNFDFRKKFKIGIVVLVMLNKMLVIVFYCPLLLSMGAGILKTGSSLSICVSFGTNVPCNLVDRWYILKNNIHIQYTQMAEDEYIGQVLQLAGPVDGYLYIYGQKDRQVDKQTYRQIVRKIDRSETRIQMICVEAPRVGKPTYYRFELTQAQSGNIRLNHLLVLQICSFYFIDLLIHFLIFLFSTLRFFFFFFKSHLKNVLGLSF